MAYKVYIRPLLEYCISVWLPHKKRDIKNIEKVQKYYTRRILNFRDIPYNDRLQLLAIESLEYRRIIHDLCLVYKFYHGIIAVDFLDLFTISDTYTRSANSLKLKTSFSRLNMKKYFFSNRIVPLWNKLPENIINASNVSAFMARLKSVNLDIHMDYI